jgi:hypothetical protein
LNTYGIKMFSPDILCEYKTKLVQHQITTLRKEKKNNTTNLLIQIIKI